MRRESNTGLPLGQRIRKILWCRISVRSVCFDSVVYKCNVLSYELFLLQRFLRCKPDEADLDLEGEKAALFSKEINVALRQWIFPVYVSSQIICENDEKLDQCVMSANYQFQFNGSDSGKGF